MIGWKKSSAKGRPFSSLLLAQHEGGKLVYKGNVGTGFNADTLARSGGADAASSSARPRRPRSTASASRGVTWLKPELVAEIAFAEFTADGNVRHGSFLGLRERQEGEGRRARESRSRRPSRRRRSRSPAATG